MATEPQSLRLSIDADTRLAAAAGAVIRHLADAAGLEDEAAARLQSAVIAACSETFEHLTANHSQLQITFSRFSDRMEVALSHLGEDSPAVGLGTIVGYAPQVRGIGSNPSVFAAFDRVQYEAHGRKAVTCLTKYLGQVAPSI